MVRIGVEVFHSILLAALSTLSTNLSHPPAPLELSLRQFLIIVAKRFGLTLPALDGNYVQLVQELAD